MAVEVVSEAEKHWVGTPLKRSEDTRFLTGFATYADDIRVPGALQVAILRSPYAHARIVSINTDRVLKHPGVVAVVTGHDVQVSSKPMPPRYIGGLPGLEEYCMAVDKVRFFGEPVAAVAATDRYTAEDALELIDVKYEMLPAVVDPEEAMKDGAPLLYEGLGTNVVWHRSFSYGNAEEAFNQADRVVKEEFSIHRYSSTPLEPLACTAKFEEMTGELTVWSNMPSPGSTLGRLAHVLGIESNRVRLIVPDIGGNFGNKTNIIRYLVIVCLLAMKAGRPAKWFESRSEHLASSTHAPDQRVSVEVGVKDDGTILAIKMRDMVNDGAQAQFSGYHIQGRFQTIVGLYRIKGVLLDGYSVLTNTCPSGANRGVAKPMMGFVLERMVDIVAKELGLDRVEIRRRNYISPDGFPYVTPSGQCYDSGDYARVLEKALELSRFSYWRDYQKIARRKGRYVGIGLATCVEPGGYNSASSFLMSGEAKRSGGFEPASIRIDQQGKVTVSLPSPDAGQGHATSAAQVVADILGMEVADINVLSAFDSQVAPFGGMSGNYANKFSVLDISAVAGAAEILREKVLTIARHILGAENNEEIVLTRGKVHVKGAAAGKSVAVSEVARVAYSNVLGLPKEVQPGLQTTYFYSSPYAKLPDEKRRVNTKLTFGNSAHVAVVELDRETGKVEILDYTVVDDCGRMINPMIVEGQVHGSTAHGIASALYEEFIYDKNGQILTSTFMDYLATTAMEIPRIRTGHHTTPSPHTPLGTKGAGESGATPPLAAIANAVEDALSASGIRITNLPLSPEKVLDYLRKAQPH